MYRTRPRRYTGLYPKRQLLSLRYHNVVENLTFGDDYKISCNGATDPDVENLWDVNNIQPYGWDEVFENSSGGTGIYQKYTCIGARAKFFLVRPLYPVGSDTSGTLDAGTGAITSNVPVFESLCLGVKQEDDIFPKLDANNFSQMIQFPWYKYKVLKAKQQQTSLVMKWSAKKAFGGRVMSDLDY